MSRFAFAMVLLAGVCWPQDLATMRAQFHQPPDDSRVMMRWWWFGPAVEKHELERELRVMKQGGIGGVEIQPVYPLELEHNVPYLSDEFLDDLRFAAEKARELGLRVDVTLGSGWPFGGPHIPIALAAGRLRVEQKNVTRGVRSIPLPSMEDGEKLIAAFIGKQRISSIQEGRLQLRASSEPGTVQFFISSRTGQQVKRAAINAEGFVLNHYDRAAIEHHLSVVGDRLLRAFGTHPPYAVFSDSLEVYASDWTPDLLDEFRKRRGYDLTPWLPALTGDFGPTTAQVRRDWGATLTELAEERYLTPIREWAQAHGTRFRSQTYGIPPVRLSSNALVDLPEGEGWQWRTFTATRWASSASHVYGRPVTSSETWTWLHSPAFRATPLDMKAEADLHFLEGSNQLIGHGWPYSPPSAGEPGWGFYAAAVFNDHNPWWLVMPEITEYLHRVSFVLRQGTPAIDVAVYLPTEDAWSGFTAGKDSLSQAMGALLGPELIPAILDAGFNFDFIDDRAIETRGIPYPVLLLPRVQRVPQETAHRIEEFKKKGGIVVNASDGSHLARRYTPDFATGNPAIGFVHRKLADADIYFVANTSNGPVQVTPRVRSKRRCAEDWNPYSGAVSGASSGLTLAPYESRVLVFSDPSEGSSCRAPNPNGELQDKGSIDISSDWNVSFPSQSETMRVLRWWTDDDSTRFFSGLAVYEKSVAVPESLLTAGQEVIVSFGQGMPVDSESQKGPGMRALLESPIREAGIVSINGARVGTVWRPPYELEVTKFLRAGSNTIRVEVGNLALNTLAGQSPPDYKLLNLRYGMRFQAQDMDNLQPVPAGLKGPIRLIARGKD